jgi:hypothetical protein
VTQEGNSPTEVANPATARSRKGPRGLAVVVGGYGAGSSRRGRIRWVTLRFIIVCGCGSPGNGRKGNADALSQCGQDRLNLPFRIDAPIGTEKPIPEIVDYRKIAIGIPVVEKMELLLSPEPSKSSQP